MYWPTGEFNRNMGTCIGIYSFGLTCEKYPFLYYLFGSYLALMQWCQFKIYPGHNTPLCHYTDRGPTGFTQYNGLVEWPSYCLLCVSYYM